MKRPCALYLVLLAGSLFNPVHAAAQGTLTPPGSPAPTMRSLDQIYSEISKLTPPNPLVLGSGINPAQQGVIHMSAQGRTQGEIRGECTINGLEGSIVCIGFSHGIVSPRDAASGLPTGKRQHRPLIVTKYIDRTTPQFYSALVNNENLPTVTFKFFQNDAKGAVTNYFNITLTDANLAEIGNDYPNLETLEFVYRRIVWLHVPTGTTTVDDWEVPVL